MRKPQTPPSWTDIFGGDDSNDLVDFVPRLASKEVVEFLRRCNESYLHWDKLRFHPLPVGLETPSHAWAAIKTSRFAQFQPLPISLYAMGSHLRYWIPPKHQEWLHQIDRQAGGTIGTMSGNAIPDDNEHYLFNSLMEEAIASSRLEGASTTREKAKKMLRTRRRPRTRAEQMILNNYKAILEIRDLKGDKLTPALLCHLQEVLTHDTLDDATQVGRFRRQDENVAVVDAVTDEVMHQPPPATTIEERLDELCAFANSRSKPFVHPVIKAIALHFALGFIHPFADGNGRTARAVFYWYMLKRGYWLFEYLPLSRILITGPAQYERAYLYTESDGGDLTYFNHFHLKIILKAIGALHGYIEGQVRDVRDATQMLESYPGLNYRQVSFVQHCLKHPNRRYTIRQHQGTYHVSYATARSDLFGLSDVGLLTKLQEGQKLIFVAPPNILARIRNTPKSKLASEADEQEEESSGSESESSGPQQKELF